MYFSCRGLYWQDLGLFPISLSEFISLPETFSLDRAYPNPFNPVTTLRFALPSKVKVILEVYDINGRLVKELKSGIMEAGYHSVVWNAQSTASGIYFIQIMAGEPVNTQKLMLIK